MTILTAETVTVKAANVETVIVTAFQIVAVQNVFICAEWVCLMNTAVIACAVKVAVTVADTQVSHAGIPSVLGLVGTSWQKIAASILIDMPEWES